jgi:probable rRNA maturation factor
MMPIAVSVQPGAAVGARADRPRAHVRRLMARAGRAALRRDSVRDAEISVTLLDDAEVEAMNREFLSHDGPTDVISFALFDDGEPPVGDIYIGFDQAMRQAGSAGIDTAEELARLAVHGTLHVLGHDHPDGAGRVHCDMWRLQEEVLAGVFEQ